MPGGSGRTELLTHSLGLCLLYTVGNDSDGAGVMTS